MEERIWIILNRKNASTWSVCDKTWLKLLDIADRSSDMQLHENEITQMLRLAMWCLQTESSRRLKMSMVVKVLEGSANVETNIEYNFTAPIMQDRENLHASDPRSACLLSGPR